MTFLPSGSLITGRDSTVNYFIKTQLRLIMYSGTKIMMAVLLSLVSITIFAQPKVILDTDIDSDVDDAGALAMLHTFADQQIIDLIGVIITSEDPYAPICADAINRYYKRPNLPVGFLKNQAFLKNHSRYTRQIAEKFPSRLTSFEQAEDATFLYRKLLVESPDSSVILVTIGHLSNLQYLLQSTGDELSSLNGRELIEKKVIKWLCMGGNFPEGKEANFYRPDPESTVYCLKVWSRPVIFAGWEVGEKIKTGGQYLKDHLSPSNPVYQTYQLYNNFEGRSSWDQVAIFMLSNEANNYFTTVKNGYCRVYADGSNKWISGKEGQHAYIRLKDSINYEEIARLMDDLVIQRK